MMPKKMLALALVAALAISVGVVAQDAANETDEPEDPENEPVDVDEDDEPRRDHGLCTAWEANENGRRNGNAANSTAFQGLQDRADDQNQTVEEYCDDVGHPSDQAGDEAPDDDEDEEADGNETAPEEPEDEADGNETAPEESDDEADGNETASDDSDDEEADESDS